MTKTLLHVGCGSSDKRHTTRGFQSDEWQELRFDINPAVQPDIIGSMTQMSGVADASVDAVYSSHNLEHLYPHEVALALREFQRVLKPDGFAVITCPDMKSVCALVAQDKLEDPAYQSPAGPIAPIDILYGHRPSMAAGNLFMAHRTGFTEKTMQNALKNAGFPRFGSFAIPAAFELWALGSKNHRPDQEIMNLMLSYCVK